MKEIIKYTVTLIMLLVIIPQLLISQENSEEWKDFAGFHGHTGVKFFIPADSISIDEKISIVFFDVLKIDPNDNESFYRAINFVFTERKEWPEHFQRFYARKVEDGEKVNFTLHYSKLIEYLIRYKVEEFDVIPTEYYAYNEQLGLKVYAWTPNSLAEEFREMIIKDVCPLATIQGDTFNLNMRPNN
jgi:hypothetical protein